MQQNILQPNEMQDIQEIVELLKTLNREQRREIYFVIKGVALKTNSETLSKKQTA